MTNLHAEHATVVAISNRLFAMDEAAWRRLLALARHLDVTLLALVYHRLREVRDDVAREAFTRRVSIAEVARERLAVLGGVSNGDQKRSTQVRDLTTVDNGSLGTVREVG